MSAIPHFASICALLAAPVSATAVSTAVSTATSSLATLASTSGITEAFSLIFLSELGDKTFFIAALLAAKTSRLLSFAGSLAALFVVTLISVAIGVAFHSIPSAFANGLPIDDYAAALAFTAFGIKTLKDALEMQEEGGMELELESARKDVENVSSTSWSTIGLAFFLVFAAEFGDRSFISTIALAASRDPIAVAVGAIFGHTVATTIAVAGGAIVGKYVSERVLGFISGALFLFFAVTTFAGLF